MNDRAHNLTRNPLAYLSGFGNEHKSEAIAGAVPERGTSPQRHPLGLYHEQISGTPFTAGRSENRRTWMYRIRPSTMHGAMTQLPASLFRSAPFNDMPATPNRMRWAPLPIPDEPCDFLQGLRTVGGNGDVAQHAGMAMHWYAANRTMKSVFYNADGELAIFPQSGTLHIFTELGRMELPVGEIGVIPRGIKFRVEVDGPIRGFVCENYGRHFRLPDLGVVGANGLAYPRDFMTPTAAFEDTDEPVDLIVKYEGNLWATRLAYSPLDVVGWFGNHAPYKYPVKCFNTLNTVSFDHPDPSIFTFLTSPSMLPGTANVDICLLAPRWQVAEESFRGAYFHSNVCSEFIGLLSGSHESKGASFSPGSSSLHNGLVAHGPDVETFEAGYQEALVPRKLEGSLSFLVESGLAIRPTPFAVEAPQRQDDYDACWSGFRKMFGKGAG